MSVFEPVVANPDLWINPSPEGLWSRVAVCSRWADEKAVAERWRYRPAVVGPLRTEAGLDLLVRSLLANPQIRVVFIDGPDTRPTNDAGRMLRAFFEEGDTSVLSEDLRELGKLLLADGEGRIDGLESREAPAVRWVGSDGSKTRDLVEDLHQQWLRSDSSRRGGLATYMVDFSKDRPGGKHVLPPPRPVVTDAAPHADPGDRIAADRLSEVYLRALHQILVAGRVVPTQYGLTRELLDLVTVIRDPTRSLEEFESEKHPVLGMSAEDLAAYTYGEDGFLGTRRPKEAPYAYGERMRGTDDASSLGGHPDQVERVGKLLREVPGTRAAYLTPWWPDEDAGKESGRPCLVGAWFRSTPGPVVGAKVEPYGSDPESAMLAMSIGSVDLELPSALHLTVVFRSHDLLGAYPQNLGAACQWLVDEATRLGMTTGTVTCVSMSAHIYERGWEKAEILWKGYRRKGIRWDGRAAWRVEKVLDLSRPLPAVQVGEQIRLERDGGTAIVLQASSVHLSSESFQLSYVEAKAVCWLDGDGIEHHRDTELWFEVPDQVRHRWRETLRYPLEEWLYHRGWRKPMLLRATAMVPGSARVVGVFEASSGSALRIKLEDSGLLQEIGSAMWLGSEIERVENGRT